MRSASESNIGPDFGKNRHNPSRDVYKTKADVVKPIQQAVADGANLIQQQGEAGLDKMTKYAWGNRLVHNSYTWMFAIEHSGEHYGQLVSTIARTTWCRRTRGGRLCAYPAVLTGVSPLMNATLMNATNGHHRKKGIACALDD